MKKTLSKKRKELRDAKIIQELKEIIKEQQKIIRVLSNREIVKGLKSTLEDFKKGRYTISIKGDKLR